MNLDKEIYAARKGRRSNSASGPPGPPGPPRATGIIGAKAGVPPGAVTVTGCPSFGNNTGLGPGMGAGVSPPRTNVPGGGGFAPVAAVCRAPASTKSPGASCPGSYNILPATRSSISKGIQSLFDIYSTSEESFILFTGRSKNIPTCMTSNEPIVLHCLQFL